MYNFKNTTLTNGFDRSNLNNAQQNNYAWSISELDKYIYIGTGRNIPYNILKSINSSIISPNSITPNPVDNLPEIWRYRKNCSLPWEKVYTAPDFTNISGFRYMITHKPFNRDTFLYAASYGGPNVIVFKSTNGVNWFPLTDTVLKGTSSRAMLTHLGKLYIATIDEANPSPYPQLYRSIDPQYYSWEPVIDNTAPNFNPSLNPSGSISNMAIFNNKIYVATSSSDGAAVWRTNGPEPKLNDWTLIVDKGFGDAANKYTLSIGVYKNYLYVSGTKQLPLAWLIPLGCDIIRISKTDRWDLVVGGPALIPSIPTKGVRNKSLSGLYSGFNNPFNVYAWQIKQYNDKLLISTFDDSINMEVILDTLLSNKIKIQNLIGKLATNTIIKIYKNIVELLNESKYPFGFDLYESTDGIHFTPVLLNGFCNKYNYGGHLLYVNSSNDLYIGTANPFQGCEVWKAKYEACSNHCHSYHHNYSYLFYIRKELTENYNLLKTYMPTILKFISKN